MIEEKIPLKQGLKLESIVKTELSRHIEEKIPLKQGLKRRGSDPAQPSCKIEEKIPLKQGLKLSFLKSVFSSNALKRRFH